jgi:MIP family channel proteins
MRPPTPILAGSGPFGSTPSEDRSIDSSPVHHANDRGISTKRDGDRPDDGPRDRERPSEPPTSRRLLAELVGTAALVFVAVGSDAMARLAHGEISTAARAVAPGLMVGALIYAIGDVSGAHLNPAVTAAFALKRLFPPPMVLPYWAAQAAGALLASGIVAVLFGDAVEAGVSTPHVSAAVAVSLEVILTTLLVLVILGTADRARIVGPDAALAVAATISLCGLIALPIEGASMNPIRSLAPAIVAGRLGDVWIYIVGPFAGALVAVATATALHGLRDHDAKAEEAAQGKAEGSEQP